jgi:uncharacterized protein
MTINSPYLYDFSESIHQIYIIFRLQPLSRNLRNEISSSRKIYFYDTGVRNALISNFNSLNIRNDTGPLWENFLICERKKVLEYKRIFANTYFWRTTYQQEIDYIEEREGKFHAFEFKWSPNKKVKIPEKFLEGYPNAVTKEINKDNFQEFLSDK